MFMFKIGLIGAKIIIKPIGGKLPNTKEKILEELNAQEFITTSAKTGSKVEDAFITMGKLILGE